jgi:hypothetical protein
MRSAGSSNVGREGSAPILARVLGPELRASLGTPTPIRRLSSSSRSRVWLVEFDGSPAIVKQVVDPGADARYSREMAALRLASRQRPPVAPAVLATDRAVRVMILEYLAGQGRAGDWMVDYATALARLHATAGPRDAGTLPAWQGPTPDDASFFIGLAAQLHVVIPPRLRAELHGLVDRLHPVGAYALLHGDPCPDNAVQTSAGIRFIDLEEAALGHCATELAYLRIGFPTCWCATSVPGAVLLEAESAYRSTWSSLTGGDPHGQLVDACAGWLIRGGALVDRARRDSSDHLKRLLDDDWRWGTATARQRLLHRLTVVAALAAGTPALASVAAVSDAMRERILQRWPGTAALPIAGGNPLHHEG